MGKQLAAGTGVTVGATLLMGGAAQAATLTVGSTNDTTGATDCAVATNTDCTLRDAITDANGAPGSTIGFRSGLSGTITLGSTLPAVFVPLTISGPGAGQITVDGNHAYRVFDLDPSLGDDISISGLTIANGSTTGLGAGIRTKYADLTLSDAVISGNDAQGQGGGVAAYDGGSLTIERSTISDNTADRGAGVYTTSGSGTVTTIRSSTVSGNSAASYGAGVYFDYSSAATLENSTIYGNISDHGSGGGLYHFGAYNGDPGLVITGSTITHNTAYRGGGLACYGTTGNSDNPLTQPIVRNTIIAQNKADTPDDGNDLSCTFPGTTGTVQTAFSLLGSVDPETTVAQTGPDIIGQDPQLGALASNGGPTQTQKPAVGSPVIDQGAAFGLGSDQRGLGRPVDVPTIPNAAGGDGSDIGAVELQPSELPSNSFTAKVKGKKLLVTVSAAGSVGVADAKAPLSVTDSKKKKKKRKLFLKASNGSGGPPTITVALRLTKFAKQKLRQTGKLGLKSRITFTPNRGIPNTQNLKLKLKGKRKKK
jgi:hypothetical protein